MGNSVRSMAVEPNGTPWAVNENNTVYRFVSNQWTQVAFNAREVAIGHEGSIYFLGTDAATDVGDTRNYRIFRWNGATSQKLPGGAVRIAVGADGNPWVVSANSQIWRWNSGAWVNVPGAAREIYGGKTIRILDPLMDNNESKILHLARHFETVSLPDGGDKTAYYFESEGRSALSLSTDARRPAVAGERRPYRERSVSRDHARRSPTRTGHSSPVAGPPSCSRRCAPRYPTSFIPRCRSCSGSKITRGRRRLQRERKPSEWPHTRG